ncbi:DinB family protein [Streptomyces sp. NPDC048473]|uniref:DinB family protein n=1 Tax=unclassified Streptomyces TaxID=2593676 RepID=UPI00371C63BB
MTATATPDSESEIRTLLSFLAGQRRHVLGILDGLDEDALRRPVLPSGWSCLGLVQHLALDVERFWFRAVVAGDKDVIKALDDIDDAWQVGPDVPGADVLDRYRTEADLADTVITAAAADTPLAWWPQHLFGEPHLHTVRDVLLHVITETACHAGHLDAARELIDGRRWMVLA